MIDRSCEQCSAAFRVKACEVRRGGGKYCSKRCYHSAQVTGTTKDCLQCGKPFHAQVSRVARGKAMFCSRSCSRTGEHSPQWRGGRYTSNGYVMVLTPDHPHADDKGYVEEHRLVAERAIGKILPREAVVHHGNSIRNDNRRENLVICPNQSYHMGIHNRMRGRAAVREAGGDPDIHILCTICRVPKLPESFHRGTGVSGRDKRCKPCASTYKANYYQQRKRAGLL